ncbi:MAG: hypothetical protein DDT19_02249 [Syntrophomonadaceae bacterium]|nr:hypothetical protein [Bacillota bacterium]
MFCSKCGANIVEGAKCPKCGEAGAVSGLKTEGSAFMGFLILLASFFTMPLKTLKRTLQQLRELGGKGKLEAKDTDIPHLTWLGIAGNFVASLAVAVILAVSAVKALSSLQGIKYSVSSAIGGFLLNLIGGVLAAIAADWIVMVWIEILTLMVIITNNVKKIASKS